MHPHSLFLGPLLIALPLFASISSAQTVSSTVLCFAPDEASSYSITSGLNAYGIPYELYIVPSTGITLPILNSTATSGNYGGFITLSELSYNYADGWGSALTDDQWQQMYDYQTSFGVRMTRLDVYPDSDFGVTTTIPSTGCCDTAEQLISISNTTAFPTAGLQTGAGLSSIGLWHYPATITDPSIATEIAQFAPSDDGEFNTTSTAAIINNFGGREQLVWFTSWGTDWAETSNFIMHAHIHWMTRGLYVGRRRVYFTTQVDDMHLETDLYLPNGSSFRLRPEDLDVHVTWQAELNTRLPAGSSYVIEIGHNGNGDIEWAVDSNWDFNLCVPDSEIQYDSPPDTPLEFQKPLGTGTDLWPTTPTTFNWTLGCMKEDTLASWFLVEANRDHFWHISHTFTHEDLDNATYSDTNKEIQFNQAWLKAMGISDGAFSSQGLIPPGITGLHNGDAIKAWMDNGIIHVVGDSSRPILNNPINEYWPLISNISNNGYDGLVIVPRWPTPIYYNCDVANCTSQEWIDTSGGWGDFESLVDFLRSEYTRHLLGLRHDPFMFHQANMRQGDTPFYTVGPLSGNLSLLQIGTETLVQEMMRLTNWPLVSIAHDDLAVEFVDRMTLDQCNPNLSYTLSSDGLSITEVTVTADNNTCTVPIPVTFPVAATTTSSGTTTEQLGNDPLTIWTTLSGSAVTFQLSEPIIL